MRGEVGRDCQAVYQPAAAAERRFLARLRGGDDSGGAQQQPQQQVAAAAPAAPSPSPATASGSGKEDETGADGKGAPPLTPAQRAAAGDLVRSALLEDQRARTKELVDSAWQSLE